MEFGLKNPYTATWEDTDRAKLELHKVVLPVVALADRTQSHLYDTSLNLEDLLRRALNSYLDRAREREKQGK